METLGLFSFLKLVSQLETHLGKHLLFQPRPTPTKFAMATSRTPMVLTIGGIEISLFQCSRIRCINPPNAEIIGGLRMEVIKSVTLNLLEPTGVKQGELRELEHAYMEALSVVSQGVKASRTMLQGSTTGMSANSVCTRR